MGAEPAERVEPPAFLVKESAPLPAPVEAAPAPRPEPVQETRAVETRREEPKVDSKTLLESSGLVMIETDRSKAVYQPQAEEPVQLGRPRRERSKPAPQDEPLEQVETRK